MKKVLFITLLLTVPLLSMAQSVPSLPTIDERLYEVFDKDFLKKMQVENPFYIQYHNFLLDNVYTISELPKDKTSNYEEVEIKDLKHLNILKVINQAGLKRDYHYTTFYKIAHTNKLLVLLSERELVKRYNEHFSKT